MKKFSLRVETSLSNIDENRWNICASKDKNFNPFNSYQFLKALELSQSVNNSSGWNSAHLIIENNDKKIVAIVPSYLKTNSSGEYVFDYEWANAYHRAGGQYYPKLQISMIYRFVPFDQANTKISVLFYYHQLKHSLMKTNKILNENFLSCISFSILF